MASVSGLRWPMTKISLIQFRAQTVKPAKGDRGKEKRRGSGTNFLIRTSYKSVVVAVTSKPLKSRQTLAVMVGLLGISAGMGFFLISCSTTPVTVVAPLPDSGRALRRQPGVALRLPMLPNRAGISGGARTRDLHFENAAMSSQGGCPNRAHPAPAANTSAPVAGQEFIINPRKDPASCFQCHLDVQGEFNLPQHHPVIEGHMSCRGLP